MGEAEYEQTSVVGLPDRLDGPGVQQSFYGQEDSPPPEGRWHLRLSGRVAVGHADIEEEALRGQTAHTTVRGQRRKHFALERPGARKAPESLTAHQIDPGVDQAAVRSAAFVEGLHTAVPQFGHAEARGVGHGAQAHGHGAAGVGAHQVGQSQPVEVE